MVAPVREQLQEYNYREAQLTLGENIVAVITLDKEIDDNLKGKLKPKICVLVDYSY